MKRFPRPEMYQDWQEWARAVTSLQEEPETVGPEYALADHNHDTKYAPLVHNHDGVYSPVGHLHDDRYSLLGHTHPDPDIIALVNAMTSTQKESLRSLLRVPRTVARMVRTTTAAAADNRSPGVIVALESIVLNTSSIASLSRFTIPVALNGKRIRLRGQVELGSLSNGSAVELSIWKNGAAMVPEARTAAGNGTSDSVLGVISPELTVATADYFELHLLNTGGDGSTAIGANTWFEMDLMD